MIQYIIITLGFPPKCHACMFYNSDKHLASLTQVYKYTHAIGVNDKAMYKIIINSIQFDNYHEEKRLAHKQATMAGTNVEITY